MAEKKELAANPSTIGRAAATNTAAASDSADAHSSSIAAAFKKADWSGGSYKSLFNIPANGDYKVTRNGTGEIDIVNNFAWTLSKFRDEVPRIKLVEYQITKNQQLYNILRKSKLLTYGFDSSSRTDPYAGLFAADKTDFSYIFPHYDKNVINTSSSWDSKVPSEGVSIQKGAMDVVSKFGSKVLKGATNVDIDLNNIDSAITKIRGAEGVVDASPFAGIEQPLFYSGTTRNKYTIKFPLFNNISVDDTKRNLDFIRLFTYQNLKDRTSIATYNPPVFYEVQNAPGYMGSMGPKPAVWVSNFNVQNVGAVRAIDIGIGGGRKHATPEAFVVTIELTELLADSKQIFLGYLSGDGSTVNVQQTVSPVSDLSQALGKK